MPAKIVLEVVEGPLLGKLYGYAEHQVVTFGRADDNVVQLPARDKEASRYQFVVEMNPPDARLRNLSKNGTLVNEARYGGSRDGKVVEETTPSGASSVDLKDGDRIQVGWSVFIVHVESDLGPRRSSGGKGVVRCARCKNPVPPEVSELRQGEFLCNACQETIRANPTTVLHEVHAGTSVPKGVVPIFKKYEILKEIDRGAMGVVYLARRREDDLDVALKMMNARIAVDDCARERFKREVMITCRLEHSHIVRFIDMDSIGSVFFFVTEYCRGGSIWDHMKRRGGPLPLREALRLAMDALDGLAYAHEKGFVHRDIKPANLLLTAVEEGQAKLADFGIAKCFINSGFMGTSSTDAPMGAMPFIPREQVTNFKGVRPVSDVYGMGGTLYQMITGQYPRDEAPGMDPVEVILTVKATPIRKRMPEVPARIAEVIDRALSTNTKERYQDAGEFRRALGAVI